ncbi:vacuolar endopolyphosphatase-like protein [Amylocarpus encephaloides]|uniref:Endopolyphosphatase n=1 Tax=Amylocarpus encephaloides TaxID=45428 RepID=A0A9P7YLY3_9HELO|nr:vacuolar endopolyphosphatase-like protein [Amylocarpus encephaloides]
MRIIALFLAVRLLDTSVTYATPIASGQHHQILQAPLEDLTYSPHPRPASARLHGRFLHITDLHPDPHYKSLSSIQSDDACHRGKGPAGKYGAETTDCDSPYALVNATFKWIQENLKDEVDFVIWTGDSARHDNDEKIPRTQDEVLSTNRWIATKFAETFGKGNDPKKALAIPIVSTFGNNDILPHNILLSGPNKWLKSYANIWSKFIPEEQRHGFERGGWYFVEVIPNKLAVFSLNTLYFFSNNAGVDGCAQTSEPGYEHFEWLRIQLQFIRERGMKAILMGHVPPARTESKELWDETCWQKYTLWLQQYRDIIVGGLYGHMNIDHFMLHDTKQITISGQDKASAIDEDREIMDDDLSIESANDYLEELRENWSNLPNPAPVLKDSNPAKDSKKGKRSQKDKLLDKIGGPWGERFHVTNVGPSIVPNYFPTLRIVEYNISGLEKTPRWVDVQKASEVVEQTQRVQDMDDAPSVQFEIDEEVDLVFTEKKSDLSIAKKHKKKKGKKHKKKPKHPKDPNLVVPAPPTKSSPPGPAYSPQSLTMLGYTQYFANLTHINNLQLVDALGAGSDDVWEERWREGKHKGKHPKNKTPHPNPFKYQVEYDTFNDTIYKMKDMTVRSYLRLAHRIGKYKPKKGDSIDGNDCENGTDEEEDYDIENETDVEKHKKKHKRKHKKHKKKKHHRQHEKNKVWLTFIQRAFIGTLDEEELRSFDSPIDQEAAQELSGDPHDGEL